MTFEEFDKLTEEMFDKVRTMRDTKGKEYANGADRFANFKEIADEVGLTPLQVWHVYYKKQIRAIDSYIKTGRVFSEAIEMRYVDALTYLLLGYGLVLEAKEKNDALDTLIVRAFPEKQTTNIFCAFCRKIVCECK